MKKSKLSTAKGTIDLAGSGIWVRQFVIGTIKSCFQTMDAVELDTPSIERYSIVEAMYGDEFDKQVYKLVNLEPESKSEISSSEQKCKEILRYDMTVPLVRYCGTYKITALRRYHIGKVYRRDNPSIQTGRLREFCQADFDIVGDDFGSGIHDWEMIDLLVLLGFHRERMLIAS